MNIRILLQAAVGLAIGLLLGTVVESARGNMESSTVLLLGVPSALIVAAAVMNDLSNRS
jgi:NhaP-type Na+/H+ or K+/H+ antiporter